MNAMRRNYTDSLTDRPESGANIQDKSGAKGNRTPDLLDANETRYQLRYSPLDGREATSPAD